MTKRRQSTDTHRPGRCPCGGGDEGGGDRPVLVEPLAVGRALPLPLESLRRDGACLLAAWGGGWLVESTWALIQTEPLPPSQRTVNWPLWKMECETLTGACAAFLARA
jgi:hypothetical protein